MKKNIIGLVLTLCSVSAYAQTFVLQSEDIAQGKALGDSHVFNGFGCSGKNISPQLSWKNPPPGTLSFAVTVYDPDAPTGSGWWHWTMVNIPANVQALPANAGDRNNMLLPKGAVQGRNDYGYAGFGGACPPEGASPHRYRFTIWALKTAQLPIDNESSGALAGFMLNANVLATADLDAVYGR